MLKVCAWCDRRMDQNEYAVGDVVPDDLQREASHGICRGCAAIVMHDWQVRKGAGAGDRPSHCGAPNGA